MEQPNSSEAFDADAERAEGRNTSSNEVDELRAEIARLKGRDRGREAASSSSVEVLEAPEKNDDGKKLSYVEIRGDRFEFRVPSASAMMAFGVGVSDQNGNPTLLLRTMQQLLSRHLTADSFELMMSRLMDPDDDFSDRDFAALTQALAEAAGEQQEREQKNRS